MRNSVPCTAVVSCHVERPLDDEAWARFDRLQRRRPGGFDVIALMRPPDEAYGEDEDGLARACARRRHARAVRSAHALDEPDAMRVRPAATPPNACVARRSGCATAGSSRVLLRRRLVHRTTPCGRRRGAGPRRLHAAHGLSRRTGILPTTHSLGALARAVLRPLPRYVHAYFHDYDLLDTRRRARARRCARACSDAAPRRSECPEARSTMAAPWRQSLLSAPARTTAPGRSVCAGTADIRSAPVLPSRIQVRALVRRTISVAALVVIDLAGLAGSLYLALVLRELYCGAASDPLGHLWDDRGEVAAVPHGRDRARLLAARACTRRASGAPAQAASSRRSCS